MIRRLALLAAVLLSGCQSRPPAANLQRVQRLYEERLDGAASRTAELMLKQRSPGAATAAWYGGLAEFRNHDMTAASTFFIAATRAGDPTVAGGAEAMLGQIATDRTDYAEALRRYERAWSLLRGSDQTQAGIRALAAAETAGNALAADRWRKRLSTSGAMVATADHPYALQAGAYRTRGAADKHAASLAAIMRRSGLTPVTVRTRRDNGGTWWLVQCGAFASRAEAVAARRSAPSQDLIVARVGQ
jgi:hypothetical protein